MCQGQLVELQAYYPQFRERNIQLAAISTDTISDALKMAKHAEAEFPVLADSSKAVARQYGVYNLLDDRVAAPATFILDQDATIIWYQVGQNIADRPAAEDILGKVSRN
ncbi:MAG: peroxiredoxin family protein [Dehalococcoidia bacterium]